MRLWLPCLVMLLLIIFVSGGDGAPSTTPGRQLLYSQKIPTYNDADNDGYPGDWGNMDNTYFTHRILYAAMVGIVLACISAFVCVCWSCCNCWSANCGDENCCRTGSCCRLCCNTGGPSETGYTQRQRSALFCMLLFITGWVVVCCLFGGKGVHDVVDGAQLVMDEAVQAVTNMESINSIVQTAMTALGLTYDASQMNDSISSVKTDVSDYESKVDDNADNIKIGAYVFYGIFVANLLLGLISYVCRVGTPAGAMAVIGFVLLAVCWVLFAIFYATGAFLDDTCVQLQLWYDCAQSGADVTALGCSNRKIDDYLKCPNATEFSSDYATTYDSMYSLIDTYSTTYSSNSVQFATPNSTISTTSSTDYNSNKVYRNSLYTAESAAVSGCTPSTSTSTSGVTSVTYSCVSTCTGSINPPTTAECYQKAILASADVLLGLSYVSSCTYLTDLAQNATESNGSCDKLGNGFIYEFGAQGAIGMLYFFVIFVGINGYHVWQFRNYAEQNQAYAEQEMTRMAQQQALAAPGSVSAGRVQTQKGVKVSEKAQIEPPEKYEAFHSDKFQGVLDNYFATWTGVPGPPPECRFHNMLTNNMREEEDHGIGVADDNDVEEEDEDDGEGDEGDEEGCD